MPGKFSLPTRDKLPDYASKTQSGESIFYRSHTLPMPLAASGRPLLKQSEIAELAEPTGDPRVGTYRLWVPEEKQQYVDTLDYLFNNPVKVLCCERRFIREHLDYLVHVEWIQTLLRLPNIPGAFQERGTGVSLGR